MPRSTRSLTTSVMRCIRADWSGMRGTHRVMGCVKFCGRENPCFYAAWSVGESVRVRKSFITWAGVR